MLSAFYELATGRAPDMLRAYLLAVLVQMLAVNTLAEYGYLHAAVPLWYGLATPVAGVVFGLGMVLAMGCAGAVFYRLGEGKLDYLFSVAGFSVGAWAGNNWLVQPARAALGAPGAPSASGAPGVSLTLNTALTLDRWVVIAVLLVAALLWVIRGKRRHYQGGLDWSATGLLIGLIGVGAWLASAPTGSPSGLGTVVGSDSLATLVLERNPVGLSWSLFLILGIPLGSFIATRLHGRSSEHPLHWKRVPAAIAGGLLMGLGASVAAGDNILHGLSGVPLLAVGSLVFMVCAFLGVWAGIRLGWLH